MNVKSVKQTIPNLISSIQNVTKKAQATKTRPHKMGAEISKTLMQQTQKDDIFPSSSDEEHAAVLAPKDKTPQRKEETKTKNVELDEIEKHISMLKSQISIKRTSVPAQQSPAQKAEQKKMSQSVLEKLERTTSLALTDNLPFQVVVFC